MNFINLLNSSMIMLNVFKRKKLKHHRKFTKLFHTNDYFNHNFHFFWGKPISILLSVHFKQTFSLENNPFSNFVCDFIQC